MAGGLLMLAAGPGCDGFAGGAEGAQAGIAGTGARGELMYRLLPAATTADEKSRSAKCAILPVGSFEQHGDYLPLITDTVVATVLAQELSEAYPLLQLPPVTISCSHEHSAWPGTVSISATTLYSVISDVYSSVASSGLTALVILNGHGGNYVLGNVVQEGNAQGRRMALFPSGADWTEARQSARLDSSGHLTKSESISFLNTFGCASPTMHNCSYG